MSGGHNLGVSGESELLDQELKTSVGQEIVRPSPVVALVEVSSGIEGFQDHLHNQVLDADLGVLGKVGILLDNGDTFSEEVLEDCSSLLV